MLMLTVSRNAPIRYPRKSTEVRQRTNVLCRSAEDIHPPLACSSTCHFVGILMSFLISCAAQQLTLVCKPREVAGPLVATGTPAYQTHLV